MLIRRPASSRNRPFVLALVGVVLSILLVATVAALVFDMGAGIVLAPTPTPTATPRAPRAPTPDARATLIAEDVLTQVAYEGGLPRSTPNPILLPIVADLVSGRATDASEAEAATAVAESDDGNDSEAGGTGGGGQTVLVPVVSNPGAPTPTPFSTSTPTLDLPTAPPASPTLVSIDIPIVSRPGSTPTPSFTPSPTEMPPAETTPAETTPTAIPPTDSFTATPTGTSTGTSTLTPTPSPSETPSPTVTVGTPTATDFPFGVASLNARIYAGDSGRDTRGFAGPGLRYTSLGTFSPETEVDIIGRSATGEWIFVCCLDGRNVWMRQASVRLVDNFTPEGAPESFNPNDVRRLPLRTVEPALTPAPEATPSPVPADDFPQQQRLPSNEASQPVLPGALAVAWNSSPAGGNLTSPAVVSGDSVVVASADNHLYSYNRSAGSQQWRLNIGTRVTVAPAVRDDLIVVVDVNGSVIALRDNGNSATELWRSSNGSLPPTSGPTFVGDLPLVAGSNGATHAVALFNSSGQRGFAAALDAPPQHPAVGDQLTYIGHAGVSAYDMRFSTLVWENSSLLTVTAPPVYSWPGVRAAADLYVAEAGGDVVFLDANSGLILDRYDNASGGSDTVTALAVSDAHVYVAGNNFLYALRRTDAEQAWRVDLPGSPVGAPVAQRGAAIGDERVLVVTSVGVVQIYSGATGSTLVSASVPSVGGAAAAGGNFLFVPGADSTLRAFRGP